MGSRGISDLATVCARCLTVLKKRGLKPFIVPAMGSHGGATPEGQKKVLEKLGITRSEMGVPVAADMDTVCVGRLESGVKVYFSQKALEADIEKTFDSWLERTAIIHLHGVKNKQDHLSLDVLPPKQMKTIINRLHRFSGTVSMEVFSFSYLSNSLNLFEDYWKKTNRD